MVTTLVITRGQAKRIADLAGPRPVPEMATRAEDRRYKRAIIRAVGEVCGRDARKAIIGAAAVRVEIVEDMSGLEFAHDVAEYVQEMFDDEADDESNAGRSTHRRESNRLAKGSTAFEDWPGAGNAGGGEVPE